MAKNIFNSILVRKPQTSNFDLSHDVKLSGNLGQLIPICNVEVIPGDTFHIGCESLLRFAPLISPVMHRLNVFFHYFFVPYRLLWDQWEDYITGGQAAVGDDPPYPPPPPAFPYIDMQEGNYGDLADYFGIPNPPVATPTAERVNAMPFAAYTMIWNEYYRDQNLQQRVTDQLDAGDNTTQYEATWNFVRNRCWEHDYFTSALPFAQKGAAVGLPIGGFNDVPINVHRFDDTTAISTMSANEGGGPGSVAYGVTGDNALPDDQMLYAKTSLMTQTTATINDLRRAEQLQKWLEANARGGSRYTESMLMHFGVRSSDARLQRPEYITGTKSPVVISEILNTTGTDDLPQGNMSGHGVSVSSGGYGKYYAEEHGIIIGLMSVMPKTAYQNGIPKLFTKYIDRFQFAWPEFANIGEQEVFNKELYGFDPGASGDDVFGYVPRYAEYKFEPSRVAGDFRTTLKSWHFGRIFNIQPHLTGQFVTCEPRQDPFAVVDEEVDKLYCHVLNKISVTRRLPKYGVPSLG